MSAHAPALQSRVFASIRDVPREQWNGLLGTGSCTYSHEFWQVVEAAGLNDFQCRYVLFYDEAGAPAALASFYTVTTDLAIFAQDALRRALAAVRRRFPDFLKLRLLECGTPITVNSPPLVVRPDVSAAAVGRQLAALLLDVARRERHFLIVMRDFEPNADGFRPVLEDLGYHWVDSLPNTYLAIRWQTPDAYRGALKSYYRSKLMKHLRRNEALGVSHELVEDFAALADTLCAQWRVVHDHADEFQREVLTPAFYREFSTRLGERSKALLFRRGGALIGHALLLQDGDTLRWLYFGRNEPVNDGLYLYVANAVVDTAIALGARRLEMGLTTYAVKQDLGGRMTPIRLALRSPRRLINAFVGLVYPWLNHTPPVQVKEVFKQAS